MLTYRDNFLTDEECDLCIKLHAHYYEKFGKSHRGTKVFQIHQFLQNDPYSGNLDFYFLKLISTKISAHINSIDQSSFPHYWEIVEWPPEEYQLEHHDDAIDAYTSIVYLNDNYSGGETFFGESRSTPIKPKKGRIVTFTGNNILHGVMPVKNFSRFTIPVWYGRF